MERKRSILLLLFVLAKLLTVKRMLLLLDRQIDGERERERDVHTASYPTVRGR